MCYAPFCQRIAHTCTYLYLTINEPKTYYFISNPYWQIILNWIGCHILMNVPTIKLTQILIDETGCKAVQKLSFYIFFVAFIHIYLINFPSFNDWQILAHEYQVTVRKCQEAVRKCKFCHLRVMHEQTLVLRH